MAQRIYPYQTLFGPLDLKMKNPYLTNGSGIIKDQPEEDFDQDSRIILLWPHDEAGWEKLNFDINVSAPKDEIELFEKGDNTVQVTAVTVCQNTHMRQAFHLNRTAQNCWEGNVELLKEHFSGKATFQCFITGYSSGRSNRYLAETKIWTLYFEEAKSRIPRGSLDVKWVDFSTDPNLPHLKIFSTEMVYVDLTQPKPVVYLNKGFDGLPELFAIPPRPYGSRLAVLESVRTSIAQRVWFSLFQTAMSGIQADHETSIAQWPSEEWQTTVLKMFLPHLYTNLPIDTGLQQVYEAREAGDIAGLESVVLGIISKIIIREGHHVRKALRSYQEG